MFPVPKYVRHSQTLKQKKKKLLLVAVPVVLLMIEKTDKKKSVYCLKEKTDLCFSLIYFCDYFTY